MLTETRTPATPNIQPSAALSCYVIVLTVTILWQPESRLGFNLGQVSFYLILSSVVLFVHLVRHNERNWMRIDTSFLLSYFIVNFQWPAMIIISEIFPINTELRGLIENYMTFGSWLATLGMASWAIGYAISKKQPVEKTQVVGNLGPAAIVQAVLLVAFMVVAGRDYLTGKIYQEVQEGIGMGTISGPAAYIMVIMTVITVAIMLAALYNHITAVRTRKNASWFALLYGAEMQLTIVYTLLFLVAQERGQVIQILFAAGIVICSSIRPLRLPTFALAIAAGSLVFSFIGYARANGYTDFSGFFEDFVAWKATVSLANSTVTLPLGIEIIEDRGELFLGQLWATSLFSLMPFAQSIFIKLIDIPLYELNGAYLINYYVFGPNSHTGFGTSLVADNYMNFGVVGVIVCMMAYGHVCKICQMFVSARYGFQGFLAAGMFASLVFYIPRSSTLIQLQPVVWIYLFSVLMFKVRELTQVARR